MTEQRQDMTQRVREGSEPKIDPEDPCELSWGKWTITASCQARTACGKGADWEGMGLSYVVAINFHGDPDGGEHGLFGTLETGGVYADLDSAAAHAKMLTPTLTSEHMEDGDEDVRTYRRTIDTSGIIDAAVRRMRGALLAEAR